MPKLSKNPPKLSRDGNYACIYANGAKIRLGRWNTDEASLNYRRFLAEWAAAGPSVNVRSGKACLLDELALAFLTWAKGNCGRSDYSNYRTAAETALTVYGGIAAKDFGPKALAVVQRQFEQKGYARGYCNKLTNFIRTMFRWGVAQELVPESVAASLKYVQPLRVGKTTAPDRPPREDVPDEVVDQTLPHLLPTVSAMVQVQRLAGMRPNEVCRMAVGDLDMSGVIWIYRPGNHKGKWRGHHRAVALGRPEQEIIRSRLAGKSSENAVFSPKESVAEKKERDAVKRKTKIQPSQIKRAEQRAKHPRSREKEFYDSDSYRGAISRMIERANQKLAPEGQIPHWTPYQLRHAAITEISEAEGLDVVRAVAGQKSINITKHYDHSDLKVAIRMAEKRSRKPE